MSRSHFRWTVSCLALIVFAATMASEAQALILQPRENWMVGLSYGVGRGLWVKSEGGHGDVRNGVVPQIRFGRMLGQHWMLGIEWENWLIETGTVEERYRRSLQTATFTVTLHPGNPRTASGGIYLRVGAGIGWAGTAVSELDETGMNTGWERVDDTGWGLLFAGGYDFWISRNLQAGLGLTLNYMDTSGGEFIEEAAFTSAVFNLGWYW